jgi:hypothetical protein
VKGRKERARREDDGEDHELKTEEEEVFHLRLSG